MQIHFLQLRLGALDMSGAEVLPLPEQKKPGQSKKRSFAFLRDFSVKRHKALGSPLNAISEVPDEVEQYQLNQGKNEIVHLRTRATASLPAGDTVWTLQDNFSTVAAMLTEQRHGQIIRTMTVTSLYKEDLTLKF